MGGRASFARGLERHRRARAADGQVADLRARYRRAGPGADGAVELPACRWRTKRSPTCSSEASTNYEQLLRFLADHLLAGGFGFDPPARAAAPRHLSPGLGALCGLARHDPTRPTIGVLFYRSHLLSGNTEFVDALVRGDRGARRQRAARSIAYSLKEAAHRTDCRCAAILRGHRRRGDLDDELCDGPGRRRWPDHRAAGRSRRWSSSACRCCRRSTVGSSSRPVGASPRGLTPLDTAMNVALPEFDGRIIRCRSRSRKSVGSGDRAGRTGRQLRATARACRARRRPGAALGGAAAHAERQKRLGVVLTNYNAKASRIGNAVGLDTPASRAAPAARAARRRLRRRRSDRVAGGRRCADGGADRPLHLRHASC